MDTLRKLFSHIGNLQMFIAMSNFEYMLSIRDK
jgi:hypothetical protein